MHFQAGGNRVMGKTVKIKQIEALNEYPAQGQGTPDPTLTSHVRSFPGFSEKALLHPMPPLIPAPVMTPV